MWPRRFTGAGAADAPPAARTAAPATNPDQRGNRRNVVVNHLHFRDPISEDTLQSCRNALHMVVDAGGTAARVLQVDDRHLILLLDFDSQDQADRVAREVGGPWMREHIVPLLADGTQRSVGTVVASARA